MMNQADVVYKAKLEAKRRLIAKYGEDERLLKTIKEVAGV